MRCELLWATTSSTGPNRARQQSLKAFQDTFKAHRKFFAPAQGNAHPFTRLFERECHAVAARCSAEWKSDITGQNRHFTETLLS